MDRLEPAEGAFFSELIREQLPARSQIKAAQADLSLQLLLSLPALIGVQIAAHALHIQIAALLANRTFRSVKR